MAVHIRLQRKGATHKAFYHVVVSDSRSPRDGRFLEKLGFYDPQANPSVISLKEDRLQYWYSKGAQLSPTTAKLVKIKQVPLERAKTHTARAKK